MRNSLQCIGECFQFSSKGNKLEAKKININNSLHPFHYLFLFHLFKVEVLFTLVYDIVSIFYRKHQEGVLQQRL